MYYDPSVGTHIEQSLQLKTTWRVEQEASNCEPDGSLRRETSPSNFPPSYSVHVEWGFPVKITEFGNMYCEINTKLLEIQQNVLCLQRAFLPTWYSYLNLLTVLRKPFFQIMQLNSSSKVVGLVLSDFKFLAVIDT